jgi:hypothetical protein
MAAMIRHFGPVIARVDEESRRVELAWDKERRQALGAYARAKVLEWALCRLEPYENAGWEIDVSHL